VDNPIQIGINTDPSDSSEGPGENQCLVEDFYWPVQDANFSCVGLVASDGTLEERYEYTPYGLRTRKAGGELPLTPALSHKVRGRRCGGRRKTWREARFIRRGSPTGFLRGESGGGGRRPRMMDIE